MATGVKVIVPFTSHKCMELILNSGALILVGTWRSLFQKPPITAPAEDVSTPQPKPQNSLDHVAPSLV